MSDEKNDVKLVVRTNPETGMPWDTKKATEAYIQKEGLREKGFHARKYQGGWAAEGPASQPEPPAEPPQETQAPPKKAEFVKVIFQPQYGDNDTNVVPMCWRGVLMYYNRGIPVIVPRVMLEQCIDHAVHNIYVSTPQGHRPAGKKKLYHYEMIGPATKEEWNEFRLKSRETQMQEFQKRGMTMPQAAPLSI